MTSGGQGGGQVGIAALGDRIPGQGPAVEPNLSQQGTGFGNGKSVKLYW